MNLCPRPPTIVSGERRAGLQSPTAATSQGEPGRETSKPLALNRIAAEDCKSLYPGSGWLRVKGHFDGLAKGRRDQLVPTTTQS
jgi:hypothetical protein